MPKRLQVRAVKGRMALQSGHAPRLRAARREQAVAQAMPGVAPVEVVDESPAWAHGLEAAAQCAPQRDLKCRWVRDGFCTSNCNVVLGAEYLIKIDFGSRLSIGSVQCGGWWTVLTAVWSEEVILLGSHAMSEGWPGCRGWHRSYRGFMSLLGGWGFITCVVCCFGGRGWWFVCGCGCLGSGVKLHSGGGGGNTVFGCPVWVQGAPLLRCVCTGEGLWCLWRQGCWNGGGEQGML